MHCQRRHVRFVTPPTCLSQPSVAPISSSAAQDHRRRSHRRAHYPKLAEPIVVALGSALARPVGLPADDQVLCPPLHSPQDRSLRSQHHPTHRSGVQLHTLVEAWHKGLTDAVFGHLPQSFPGMCNAARLLAAGRRANTWLGYAGKLKRWEEFCACAGVRQFPAHQSHVLCYLGYLQEEGAVKAGSLQQYLSDFNSWHADMGLSKQAVGQAVNMLCRGYCEVQGDEDDEAVRARRPK